MVEIIIQTKFLKPQDFNNGEKVIILDEGEYTPTKYGERFNLNIQLRNERKTATLNNTSLKFMKDKYGSESKLWVQKEVPIFKVKQMVGNKMREIVYFGINPAEEMEESEDDNTEVDVSNIN